MQTLPLVDARELDFKDLHVEIETSAADIRGIVNSDHAKQLEGSWQVLVNTHCSYESTLEKFAAVPSHVVDISQVEEASDVKHTLQAYRECRDKVCEMTAYRNLTSPLSNTDKGGRPAKAAKALGIIAKLGGSWPPALDLILQQSKSQ